MIIHNKIGQLANQEDIQLIEQCCIERERLKDELQKTLAHEQKLRKEIRELGITKLCKKLDIDYKAMKKIMERFV